jgi:tetratricopeptide (TPR) repeat protein
MTNLKQGALHAILVVVLFSPVAPVAAQRLVAPTPITQAQPSSATNAVGESVDGWAVVRYSVLTDGTTSNVEVIESAPPSLDVDGVLEAARGWTFEPATSDGEAIEWHNGESVVSFGEITDLEPSDAFVARYDSVVSLIDENRFPEALEASLMLLNEQAKNRLELGLSIAQVASINVLGENPQRALRYLQLATDRRATVLPLEDLFAALQLKLRVETELGRWREALETYEWIAAGLDPNAPNPFADVAKSLQGQWDNAEFLEIKGQIGDTPWRYDIGRRYFYIDNIDGMIQTIDVECDTRRLTIDFESEADYQLPEDFGACTLFINGTPGTTFSYIGVLPPSN